MIVIDCDLVSARGAQYDKTLGTIVIDNIGGTHAVGNYRVRAYKKGHSVMRDGLKKNVFREARIEGHARNDEPVWELVHKALTALGYGAPGRSGTGYRVKVGADV